jgi:hypothetical protein
MTWAGIFCKHANRSGNETRGERYVVALRYCVFRSPACAPQNSIRAAAQPINGEAFRNELIRDRDWRSD